MSKVPLQPFPLGPFRIHPPAHSYTVTPTGGLTLRAVPKTDWWHTPHPDPADRRTGSFYAMEIEGDKDFECGVWIKGEWDRQYDQGCLMLLVGEGEDIDGDWLKTGIELDGGKEWIGAVVASPWSDWSIALAPQSTHSSSTNPYAVYLQVTRTGATLTIRHAFVPDPKPDAVPTAEELVMMREVKAFAVDAEGKPKTPPGGKWRIGPMVCGPTNEEGTVASFEGFSFRYL